MQARLNRSCLLLLFLLPALMNSCKKSTDKVSFDQPKRQYDLAVEGGINTLTQTQFIRLSKPSSKADIKPSAISKATVTVNDGIKDIIFKETSTAGLYSGTNNPNIPNYNKAYTLTIRYDNKTYTAVDTLRQVVNITDDFLPFTVKKNAGGTYDGTIPKHTFGYLNPNKWWISYTGIPVWNPSKFDGTETTYFSYTHFLGSPNSLYPLSNLKRTFSLMSEDVITIYKFSLSKEYAKYLYGVFLETDWKGLFSNVPVNVNGNVSGNAQGYFYVTDIDYQKYKVSGLK
ncbi:hypothetical protein TH53_15435 [Pedobacter lusitanus]|uniref:DUF4249 domain-containing protein n=1 Tax=Pedobacter lusitanus TaxID=1503925 RepID=A0A0D0FVD6_9SPHI|nr:hypothetical protein TH53_15435 [Pedobacter lusitanus]